MNATIKTRCVAGAAYKASDIRSTLTHSVDEATGLPLCKRVKADSLLDDDFATDPNLKATCPACAKKDPRFFNSKGVWVGAVEPTE
jgi:hypothetical protein